MDRVIAVEILGRGGRVAERVRLGEGQLPATIGRGYACDVIVDDPFADASHARLFVRDDGALVVEDLGSTNGLSRGEHGERVAQLELVPGATFRIGHTLLRVATSATPVAPALRDLRSGSRGRRLVHRRLAALPATVGGALLFGLASYLGSMEQPGGGEFVLGLVAGLVLVPLWAGGWALGTRMRSGRARFLAHLTVAWLGFVVLLVLATVDGWVNFLTADSWLASAVAVVTGVLGGTLLLYGHLAVASNLSRARRAVAGVTTTVLIMLLAYVVAESGVASRHDDIAITMPLKPLGAGLIPAETPEAFLESIVELQHDVDTEAEQK